MSEVTMNVTQRKEFCRKQKDHLRKLIVQYQPAGSGWTESKLAGKTLKQLERLANKLGV